MKKGVKTRLDPLNFDSVIFEIFQRDDLPKGCMPIYAIEKGSTTFILSPKLDVMKINNKNNDQNVLPLISMSIDSTNCEKAIIQMFNMAVEESGLIETSLESLWKEMMYKDFLPTRVLCHPNTEETLKREYLKTITCENINEDEAYILTQSDLIGAAPITGEPRFGIGLFNINSIGKLLINQQ